MLRVGFIHPLEDAGCGHGFDRTGNGSPVGEAIDCERFVMLAKKMTSLQLRLDSLFDDF